MLGGLPHATDARVPRIVLAMTITPTGRPRAGASPARADRRNRAPVRCDRRGAADPRSHRHPPRAGDRWRRLGVRRPVRPSTRQRCLRWRPSDEREDGDDGHRHGRPAERARPVAADGLLGLSHIGFTVVDLDRAIDFWCTVMGFRPVIQDEGLCMVWQPSALLAIGLSTQAGSAVGPFDPHHVGLDHLALAVADVPTLRAWA